MARAKENLDVAKRENSVILYESNYQERYAGFNPNRSERMARRDDWRLFFLFVFFAEEGEVDVSLGLLAQVDKQGVG